MSLSAEKKRKSRGRISYAQLGINQLGAVYEGLLSYTGFFATEDLYEVASEKDCKTLSGRPAAEREALKTYFVPASKIGDYREGEIVRDENGKKVVHPRGDFIFRLAGRNREKSASYYTPEVLTKCLVKYALKELLWEEGEEGEKPRRKKTADEILGLTICEPAMGSSAFLIEAVDQLADAYLEARQEELGKEVPPEDYQREKRRVKARLATNNCYGVDLNPTAVELAKISLWLATLHEAGKCPWFGLRLATGNSLVGARREVFKTADVTRRGTKDNPNWLGLVPEPVSLYHRTPLGEHWTAPPRPKGTIYHFLLPALGMAAFDKGKVIKELAPEEVRRIKEWRKQFCKPFSRGDAERLEDISDAVDRLFASDSKASKTRRELYPRLKYIFHFLNQLKLFKETLNTRRFTANVYRPRKATSVNAIQISTLYHPRTIDERFLHDGHGPVPGMNTDDNDWELRGHRSRILRLDDERLAVLAQIYSEAGTCGVEARMPFLFSESVYRVLQSAGTIETRLGDFPSGYFATEMWHETSAEEAGWIERGTTQAASPKEWILSGPHIYVACPFNKSPNPECRDPKDFSSIDLTSIRDDFLPRANFRVAAPWGKYLQQVPQWKGKPITGRFRLAVRRRLDPGHERTLAAAIIPPGSGHIDGVALLVPPLRLLGEDYGEDRFSTRTSGFAADAFGRRAKHVVRGRVLRLNCLTSAVSAAWPNKSAPMKNRHAGSPDRPCAYPPCDADNSAARDAPNSIRIYSTLP